MNKNSIYNNICDMLQNGFYFEKYCELTQHITLDGLEGIFYTKAYEELKNISANIFNAILIACQLFDDRERQEKFIEDFDSGIDSFKLEFYLSEYDITKEEAIDRLKHGFGIHFTTPKIIEEINKVGYLSSYGNNQMFTKEEDEIISKATRLQQQLNPPNKYVQYLNRGFGTGVSSYGTQTNGFWMYNTPESLTFLFGNISKRNKEEAMQHVKRCITNLSEEDKLKTFETMSNIWDRLVGDEQEIGCILIDRDGMEYPIDYYYSTGKPVGVERRPFSKNFSSLNDNNVKIPNDIETKYLRFITLPTIYKLEEEKKSNKAKK